MILVGWAKKWLDLIKAEKDRQRHEDVIRLHTLAPLLFGKVEQPDKWINWMRDVKLIEFNKDE